MTSSSSRADLAKINKARELVKDGMLKTDAAKQVGISRSMLDKYSSDLAAGLKNVPKWERNLEFWRLYCQGWSHEEIAAKYSVTAGSVSRCIFKCREMLRVAGADLQAVRCGGKAKLSPNQVRAIRADERSHREIGEEYGISRSTVHYIKARKSYKDVD